MGTCNSRRECPHEGPTVVLTSNARRRDTCTTIPYLQRAHRVVSELVQDQVQYVISPPRTRINNPLPTRSSRDRSHATKPYILSCRFRGDDSNFVGAQSPAASRTNLEARCARRQAKEDGQNPDCMYVRPAAAQGSFTLGAWPDRYPIDSWDLYCRSRRKPACASPGGLELLIQAKWVIPAKASRRRGQCSRRVYAPIPIAR
jgi:hypothetical protein